MTESQIRDLINTSKAFGEDTQRVEISDLAKALHILQNEILDNSTGGVDNGGSVRIARLNGITIGTDQTSALQALFNNAAISKVIIDNGEVTINGTVTIPSAKALQFEGSGAVTGTGTITGGSLVCYGDNQIFKGTVAPVPARVFPNNEFNARWFGASPSASGANNDTAFQRFVTAGVSAGIHNWFIPTGTYNTTKGILFRKPGVGGEAAFLNNAKIRGGYVAYDKGGLANSTVITVAANSFGIGIDRGKGVIVEAIGFEGQNNAPALLSVGQVLEDYSASFVTAGCRDDNYSPHAGLVIDPFSVAATPEEKRYPNFSDYYVGVAGLVGGSTDIIVRNCYARYLVVGFAITPHDTPQNGDHIEIRDVWVEIVKSGITVGQSQNRTISIIRVGCWGNTETVIDARRYGDGTAGMPEVMNVNIAGGVRYLCRIAGFDQNNGITFRDVHAELLGSIGGSIGDGESERAGHIKILNCFMNILGANDYGIYGAKTLAKCKKLTIENSVFLNLADSNRYRVHNIDCLELLVINSTLEGAYTIGVYNTQNIDYKFINSVINGKKIDTNKVNLNPFYASESSDKNVSVLGDLKYVEQFFNAEIPNRTAEKVAMRKSTGFRDANGYLCWKVEPVTFSSVNYTTRTANLQFTANGNDVKRLYVDQPLFTYGTNQFGDTVWIDIGHVASINVGTGVVGVKFLNTTNALTNTQFTNSQTLAELYIMRIERHFYTIVMANCTSGSVNLSVVETSANGNFVFPVDAYIDSAFFPPFTRIISYNASAKTAVMSHAALSTKNDIMIEDVAVMRQAYGSDTPTSSIGWREGDVVYNNGANSANDTVLYWVCTKNGLSGSLQGDGANSARSVTWKSITK
jgi:hypothetical protein